MPYHIEKPKTIGEGTVYFKGDNVWTDDYDDRKVFSTKSAATTQKNSTVTSELGHTYQQTYWASATIVTE